MIDTIRAFIGKNPHAVIAIDGMAAAGKSTLAEKLALEFGGEVVHMDDFFLPPELRTDERLAEAGGNVHYERFAAEVAKPLAQSRSFCYGVFDCSRMKIAGEKRIDGSGVIIVEGAYSLRPEFRELYDLKVFMKVYSDTQMRRIIARSGAEKAEMFKNKWIPLEERYFEGLKPEGTADLVFFSSDSY